MVRFHRNNQIALSLSLSTDTGFPIAQDNCARFFFPSFIWSLFEIDFTHLNITDFSNDEKWKGFFPLADLKPHTQAHLYTHTDISLIHLHTHIDCVITTPPLLYLHSLAAENFGCPHLNHSDQLHTTFFLLTHSPFPESRLDDSCCLLLPCFQFVRLMLLSQVMHTLQKGSESLLWNNHKTTFDLFYMLQKGRPSWTRHCFEMAISLRDWLHKSNCYYYYYLTGGLCANHPETTERVVKINFQKWNSNPLPLSPTTGATQPISAPWIKKHSLGRFCCCCFLLLFCVTSVCACVCACVCVFGSVWMCACMHMCVCACMCACVCAYMHACVCVCMCVCVRVCVHVCVCVCSLLIWQEHQPAVERCSAAVSWPPWPWCSVGTTAVSSLQRRIVEPHSHSGRDTPLSGPVSATQTSFSVTAKLTLYFNGDYCELIDFLGDSATLAYRAEKKKTHSVAPQLDIKVLFRSPSITLSVRKEKANQWGSEWVSAWEEAIFCGYAESSNEASVWTVSYTHLTLPTRRTV